MLCVSWYGYVSSKPFDYGSQLQNDLCVEWDVKFYYSTTGCSHHSRGHGRHKGKGKEHRFL